MVHSPFTSIYKFPPWAMATNPKLTTSYRSCLRCQALWWKAVRQRGNGHKTDSWHEAATWRLGNFRLATLMSFKLQNTHPNHPNHPNHQLYPHTLRFIELCFKNTVGRPQHKGFLRAMEAPHQRAKSHETDYSNCLMIQPPWDVPKSYYNSKCSNFCSHTWLK